MCVLCCCCCVCCAVVIVVVVIVCVCVSAGVRVGRWAGSSHQQVTDVTVVKINMSIR